MRRNITESLFFIFSDTSIAERVSLLCWIQMSFIVALKINWKVIWNTQNLISFEVVVHLNCNRKKYLTDSLLFFLLDLKSILTLYYLMPQKLEFWPDMWIPANGPKWYNIIVYRNNFLEVCILRVCFLDIKICNFK
jgi:hypothetical protein